MAKEEVKLMLKKMQVKKMFMNEIEKLLNINNAIKGKNILKSIYVPNKILNIVLKS